MNLMILGGKPDVSTQGPCPAHTELVERIARIEERLESLEKALAARRRVRVKPAE